MLVIHTGGEKTFFTQDALVVTKKTHPEFFNVIGESIWELLDSVRNHFE
jgi:hypothetical protein